MSPMAMDIKDNVAVDVPTAKEVVSSEEEPKKKGPFNLSITDPQDWITVFLSGVILYQTIDLVAFYGAKLLGTGSS